MGIDFIRRRAKTFTKAWNRNRVDLAQPTLFTRYPECHSRSIVADFVSNDRVSIGASVMVRASGTELVLVDGLTSIGTVSNPPYDLMTAINEAGGHALGHITKINPISGTVDVEIE